MRKNIPRCGCAWRFVCRLSISLILFSACFLILSLACSLILSLACSLILSIAHFLNRSFQISPNFTLCDTSDHVIVYITVNIDEWSRANAQDQKLVDAAKDILGQDEDPMWYIMS